MPLRGTANNLFAVPSLNAALGPGPKSPGIAYRSRASFACLVLTLALPDTSAYALLKALEQRVRLLLPAGNRLY